jgi:hypothetical protein
VEERINKREKLAECDVVVFIVKEKYLPPLYMISHSMAPKKILLV